MSAHDAQPAFGVGELLPGRDEIPLRALKLARRLNLAHAKARDACRLFKDQTTLDGIGREHRIDLALLDDRVGVVADSRVEKQVANVLQTHLFAVDQVVALGVDSQPARDLDKISVDGQSTVSNGAAVHHALDRFASFRIGFIVEQRGVFLAAVDQLDFCFAEQRILERERDARHARGLARR